MTSLTREPTRAPFRADFWRLFRENAFAAGAGAWIGLLVGGVGGRLVMFLLRLTSPDRVIGIDSDDGFTIGQVTFATFNLLAACATIGAVAGVGYWLFRSAVRPRRLRRVAWTLFCGLLGGAVLVQSQGVDFLLLEPLSLSVTAFVAIPAVAGAGIAMLADRWLETEARLPKRTAVFRLLPVLPSLIIPIGLVLAVAGSAGWAILARVPVTLQRGAQALGAAIAVAMAGLAASDLANDLSTLAEI